VRVVKEREGGVVRRVRLVDGDGEPVTVACRFLDHLIDRGLSPAHDLRVRVRPAAAVHLARA
jgi:hypothetical protein